MDMNLIYSIACSVVLITATAIFFFSKLKKISSQQARITQNLGKSYWSIPGWSYKRDFEYLTELIERYTEREFDIILLEISNKFGINKDAIINDAMVEERSVAVASTIWNYMGNDYRALISHYIGDKQACLDYICKEVHFKMLKLCNGKNRSTIRTKIGINPLQPEKPVMNIKKENNVKRSDI